MQQLSGIDVTFLYAESMDNTGHISSVYLLDPSTAGQPINADTIRAHIASRIHLTDPLRWRLVEIPFGLDRPYWVEDPDLDLTYHVRGIALPAPGSRHQLAEQVERLVSRPLDRAHPLWEIYVIEGVANGLVAVLTKLHHAAVDGKAGMQIMTTLLDTEPNGRVTPPPTDSEQPPPIPNELEMLGISWLNMLRRPQAMLKLGYDLAIEGFRLQRQLSALAQSAAENTSPAMRISNLGKSPNAPRMILSQPVSKRRSYAFRGVDLSIVKAIKTAAGCTVNDVVMAMCTNALRRWLVDHDALPDARPRAMVPVSIRTEGQSTSAGNQVSSIVVELPTDLDDPLEQLATVRETMNGAKEMHKAVPAHLLTDLAQFSAPAAGEQLARTFAALKLSTFVDMPFNLCISNVPGPRETLYYAGAELLANFPVSMVGDGSSLNITVQSYRDRLDIGLLSTPEIVPDIWNLMGYFGDALEALAIAYGVDYAPLQKYLDITEPSAKAPTKAAPKKVATKKSAPKKAAPKKAAAKDVAANGVAARKPAANRPAKTAVTKPTAP